MTNQLGMRYPVALLVLFFALMLLLAPREPSYDQKGFINWAQHIRENGVGSAYRNVTVNHGPVLVSLIAIYSFWAGTPERIERWIHQFKILLSVFDFAAIFLVMRLLARSQLNPFLAFFIAVNPAFLYDTFLWGQVDIVGTLFSFAALLMALLGRATWSGIFFVLALNTKPLALVYLLLLVMILIPTFIRNRRVILYVLIGMIVTQVALLLPYLDTPLGFLDAYLRSLSSFPFVSVNAYNFWYLVDRNPLRLSPDILLIGQWSYRQVGTFLFLVTSSIALLPLAARCLVRTFQQQKFLKHDYALVMLSAGWVTLSFFYFSTMMHERYAYAVILFWGVYALLVGEFWLYALVSLAYLLNVEMVFHALHIGPLSSGILHQPRFVAFLYFIALVWGMYKIYRGAQLRQEINMILLFAREHWKPALARFGT